MYARLSAYYFFHFATLGVLVPYLGIYLHTLGFSPTQIGSVFAVTMASKLVAPLFWARLIECAAQPFRWVRWSTFISTLALALLVWLTSFWSVLVVMLIFSFFWNAILPMMEALTLAQLGERSHRYGMIRLWGSVGFIAAVGAGGVLVSVWGEQVVLPLMLATALGIWFSLMLIQAPSGSTQPGTIPPLLMLILRPGVPLLLAMIFLMQLSHGPYYSFFTLYLREYGLATQWISFLWVVGVLGEIVFFLLAHHVITRFSARASLLICFAAAALRWAVIGLLPTSIWMMLGVQLLHAITFGAFHLVVMRLIQNRFSSQQQAQGQALYSTIGYGLGGGVGSYLSGYIWDGLNPAMVWSLAVGAALVGAALATQLQRIDLSAGPHSPSIASKG